MTDVSPQDIRLTPEGSAATQLDTPHGVVRTISRQAGDQTTPVHVLTRYDKSYLVFVMVQGNQSEPLAENLIEWQWLNRPRTIDEYAQWADNLQAHLNADARETVADKDSSHAILVGILNRNFQQGDLRLAWLGTVGVHVLNIQREIKSSIAMYPGETWTGQNGIQPADTDLHTKQFAINGIDRLFVFSGALRHLVDEIPQLSRAALQRIADKQFEQEPIVLFDLHPRQVIPEPSGISLNYRWESPINVTLAWSGSEEATGFVVEEAPMPDFEEGTVIAELTDNRQRVYTVAPPSDREAYYRVVPVNGEFRGKPSTPVITTPVPLFAPQIESITWSSEGLIRVEWSVVPQADMYELEFSPDQDFDSPQTSIVYRGDATAIDAPENPLPNGWYFRVRTRNSHFAPKLASLWSMPKRAPQHLESPTFRTVSPSVISWVPITGTQYYEIRQITANERNVIARVERNKYVPQGDAGGTYQVRAVRREGDEVTASEWSNSVTIGGALYSDEVDTAETEIGDDTDTIPIRQQTAPGRGLMFALGIAALTLFLGVVGGIIVGPQFGIGIDPSPTPISASDRDATATQNFINQDNRIARATLSSELNRVNIASTENANQLDNLETRNARVNADNDRLSNQIAAQATDANALEATLSGELESAYIAATENAGQIADLQTQSAGLEDDRDLQAEMVASIATDFHNQQATADYLGEIITTLEAQIAFNEEDTSRLQMTATANAELQATLENNIDELQSTLDAIATPTPKPLPPFGKPASGWLHVVTVGEDIGRVWKGVSALFK